MTRIRNVLGGREVRRSGIGLVLSGGGAKGAYQVGLVRALAELDIPVTAISGASIGALNGAIVAAAGNMTLAHIHLSEVWGDLAEMSVFRPEVPAIPYMLLAAGLKQSTIGLPILQLVNQLATSVDQTLLRQLSEGGRDGAMALARQVLTAAASTIPGAKALPALLQFSPALLDWMRQGDVHLFSDSPMHKLLDRYLRPDDLAQGWPLYISVYPTDGSVRAMMDWALAFHGFGSGKPADCLHLQSLPRDEWRNLLLASAALPLLFQPRELNGKTFADGGLGGARNQQGNTPVASLLDAGCSMLLVNCLDDGSMWSRSDFPEATVIELRPRTPIARDGGVSDMLGFDVHRLTSWMEQGYTDTLQTLERLSRTHSGFIAMREAAAELGDELDVIDESFQTMEEALNRMRQG